MISIVLSLRAMSSWCWIMSNFHYFCLPVQSAGAKNWTVFHSFVIGKVTQIYPDQFTQLHHEGKDGESSALGTSEHNLRVSCYEKCYCGRGQILTCISLGRECLLSVIGSHFGTEVLKRSASISVSYLRQVDLWPDLHPCTSLYSMSQNDAYHKIAMLFLGEVIINQWMEWVNCRLSLRIAAICFIYSKAGCSRRMGVCNGSKSCTKIWMVKYYNIL